MLLNLSVLQFPPLQNVDNQRNVDNSSTVFIELLWGFSESPQQLSRSYHPVVAPPTTHLAQGKGQGWACKL